MNAFLGACHIIFKYRSLYQLIIVKYRSTKLLIVLMNKTWYLTISARKGKALKFTAALLPV